MFKKILVPVDLGETELARSALEVAVELASSSKGELRVINVAESPTYAAPDYDAELPVALNSKWRILHLRSIIRWIVFPRSFGLALSTMRSYWKPRHRAPT